MPRFFFLVNTLPELLAVEAFLYPYCSTDRAGDRGEGTLYWLDRHVANTDNTFPIAVGYDSAAPAMLPPTWHQPFPMSKYTNLSEFLAYYQASHGEQYPIEAALHPEDYPEYFL